MVGPEARRLGFVMAPGESNDRRMLRARLLWALGDLGRDQWARNQARPIAERWLLDRQSVHIDIASAAVPLAAREGDEALFGRVLAVLQRSTSADDQHAALLGLASFDDPELIRRLLEMALTSKLSALQAHSALQQLFGRASSRDVAYEWIQLNLRRVVKQNSALVDQLVWIIPKLCRAERVRHATRFFEKRLGDRASLRQATQAGNRCAKLAARHAPPVEKLLSSKARGR